MGAISRVYLILTWIAPLAPVVIIMIGETCYPNLWMSSMSGVYLISFAFIFGWESIIAICEFNELDEGFIIWWCGIVWMINDKQHVSS